MVIQQKPGMPLPSIALVVITLPVFIINVYRNLLKRPHKS